MLNLQTEDVDRWFEKQIRSFVEWPVKAIPVKKDDRTGTGCWTRLGQCVVYHSGSCSLVEQDNSTTLKMRGFPLLQTKKVFFNGMLDEFIWIWVLGSSNVNDLPERVQKWWTPWANERGDLGKIYGFQARKKNDWDQLYHVLKGIVDDPTSRRHVISLWDHQDMTTEAALSCCHGTIIQFHVNPQNKRINIQCYQRSADIFLGVPVNLAHYAFLLQMVAVVTGYFAGDVIYTFGDLHLYSNHMSAAVEYLNRSSPEEFEGLRRQSCLVRVCLPSDFNQLDFEERFDVVFGDESCLLNQDHVAVSNYSPLPAIKATLNV